jgi:hypothetical protein
LLCIQLSDLDMPEDPPASRLVELFRITDEEGLLKRGKGRHVAGGPQRPQLQRLQGCGAHFRGPAAAQQSAE